jgi:hypothetical protein
MVDISVFDTLQLVVVSSPTWQIEAATTAGVPTSLNFHYYIVYTRAT